MRVLLGFLVFLLGWIAVALGWLPTGFVALLFFLSIGAAFALAMRHGGDLVQGWSRGYHDPDRRRR